MAIIQFGEISRYIITHIIYKHGFFADEFFYIKSKIIKDNCFIINSCLYKFPLNYGETYNCGHSCYLQIFYAFVPDQISFFLKIMPTVQGKNLKCRQFQPFHEQIKYSLGLTYTYVQYELNGPYLYCLRAIKEFLENKAQMKALKYCTQNNLSKYFQGTSLQSWAQIVRLTS